MAGKVMVRELVALCESRINGLSRTRQAFEHSAVPERVEQLIGELRTTALSWDVAVSRPPDGDPVALRVGARAIRDGAPGFGIVADVLEVYASALESGQARHAAGVSQLRTAQQGVAGLAKVKGVALDRTEVASSAALAALDVACAGYAACQDAYEVARDAERALYAGLSSVRVRSQR